jgi:hypothetical protein
MRNAILCMASAFSILAAAPSMAAAGAMVPFAQAATPVAPAGDGNLVLVAGGCGIGFHRGPRGFCRPNWVRPHPARHVQRCVRRWTHHGWVRVCRYY